VSVAGVGAVLHHPASSRSQARHKGVAVLMRRRAKSVSFLSACGLCLAAVLVPLGWLIGGVVWKAVPHFGWYLFTQSTHGVAGGLQNAIVGSLVIGAGVLAVAGTLGTAVGIYLAEYAPRGRGGLLRAGCELLAGVPSIVLGYLGYLVLVVGLHLGFSWPAAVLVLSLMVVPYVAKSTEVALSRVPDGYREAGKALGMTRLEVLRVALIRPALPGILTGLVIALAISVGETAPLLYTAGWSGGFPRLAVAHAPAGYLTYVVWTDYNEPFRSAQNLSYEAAFLLLLASAGLTVFSRVLKRAWRAPGEEVRQRGGRSLVRR
jgi:phosphate transport system permease protein